MIQNRNSAWEDSAEVLMHPSFKARKVKGLEKKFGAQKKKKFRRQMRSRGVKNAKQMFFNGDETLPMPLLSSFMAPFNPLPA